MATGERLPVTIAGMRVILDESMPRDEIRWVEKVADRIETEGATVRVVETFRIRARMKLGPDTESEHE